MHQESVVLKDYTFFFPPMAEPVRAKVFTVDSGDFESFFKFDISHYYKGDGCYGYYYPSKSYGHSFEEATWRLHLYMREFNPHNTIANENY